LAQFGKPRKPMKKIVADSAHADRDGIVGEDAVSHGWLGGLAELNMRLDEGIALSVKIVGPPEADQGMAKSGETLSDSLGCDLAEAFTKAECLVHQVERIAQRF